MARTPRPSDLHSASDPAGDALLLPQRRHKIHRVARRAGSQHATSCARSVTQLENRNAVGEALTDVQAKPVTTDDQSLSAVLRRERSPKLIASRVAYGVTLLGLHVRDPLVGARDDRVMCALRRLDANEDNAGRGWARGLVAYASDVQRGHRVLVQNARLLRRTDTSRHWCGRGNGATFT